jgi:5'-nucleotidase
VDLLLSNDDGIDAMGLNTLATRLKKDHTVFIVAPDKEQSASSHSLTLKSPLRVKKRGENWYAVSGTPADCVNLAINGILTKKPDMIVSGINHGANLGDDIAYSGTVSAAMEGLLLDIPSIAVSFEMKNSFDFEPAAEFTARLLAFIETHGLPDDTILNVNVPDSIRDKQTNYRITRQGRRVYENAVQEKKDSSGKKYYVIGSKDIRFEEDISSDYFAIAEGYVSITPLHLDLTNYSSIGELVRWEL